MSERIVIEVSDQFARAIALAFASQAPALQSIHSDLVDIKQRVGRVRESERRQEANIDALIASVAAGRTVDESNTALLQGIITELEHSDDPAVLALAAKLKESADPLKRAVKENTTS